MDEFFQNVTIAQLTDFAQKYGLTFPKKIKKSVVVDAVKNLLADEKILNDYYETFKKEIALSPQDTEKILQCTKAERLRWTAEGKLPVVYYESFHKFGKDLKCPYYDRLFICNSITPELLDTWRISYKEKVTANAKAAIEKSLTARHRNENLREYSNWTLNEELKFFYQLDEEAGIIFELAFWTQWVNRWAEKNELKARRAIKYGDKYLAQKNLCYTLKNTAMEILLKSKYSTAHFYVPAFPDKVFVYFCELHYQLIRDMYIGYINPLNAYYDNPKLYDKCHDCKVERQKNYYSLFCLKINLIAGTTFWFHMPYDIGLKIFPDEKTLPKIFHEENFEGYFRFGRAITEDEMIVYPEKTVLKSFHKAIEKANKYFKK